MEEEDRVPEQEARRAEGEGEIAYRWLMKAGKGSNAFSGFL